MRLDVVLTGNEGVETIELMELGDGLVAVVQRDEFKTLHSVIATEGQLVEFGRRLINRFAPVAELEPA